MTEVIVQLDPDATETPAPKVRSRAEAEKYVSSVAFRCGQPRLLGVELEWVVHHVESPRKPLDRDALAAALGNHAPGALVTGAPQEPLPYGSTVTVEPGGQVEISSRPEESMASLLGNVANDAEYVWERLRAFGLEPGNEGADAWRPPRRVLDLPRYAAMEGAFDLVGAEGKLMMCSTASVQVCLDAGQRDRVASRWAALHALGPLMIATFGNSPALSGKRTEWVSTRSRTVLRADPVRTRPGPLGADPALGWAKRLVDTPLVCRRRKGDDWTVPGGISFAEWIHGALPGPPSTVDLDYHLSTVFPPVRPRGYLEARYVDAQPGQDWMLPVAALIALLRDESTVDTILEQAAHIADRWVSAARYGLRDPVLAHTARTVFALACRCLEATDCPDEVTARLAKVVDQRLTLVGAGLE